MILGLTGGIAAGKSTATDVFNKLGIEAIDADLIARQVVAPGTEALRLLTEHFGDGILLATGDLNRKKLRTLIFQHKTHKDRVENLLHPLIRAEIRHQLAQPKHPYQLLVAPLLFENNLAEFCDKTLLIDVPESVQIERTLARDGLNKTDVQAIIASQMPRNTKLVRADYCIDNSASLEELTSNIHKLHLVLLELASDQPC